MRSCPPCLLPIVLLATCDDVRPLHTLERNVEFTIYALSSSSMPSNDLLADLGAPILSSECGDVVFIPKQPTIVYGEGATQRGKPLPTPTFKEIQSRIPGEGCHSQVAGSTLQEEGKKLLVERLQQISDDSSASLSSQLMDEFTVRDFVNNLAKNGIVLVVEGEPARRDEAKRLFSEAVVIDDREVVVWLGKRACALTRQRDARDAGSVEQPIPLEVSIVYHPLESILKRENVLDGGVLETNDDSDAFDASAPDDRLLQLDASVPDNISPRPSPSASAVRRSHSPPLSSQSTSSPKRQMPTPAEEASATQSAANVPGAGVKDPSSVLPP